MNWKKYIIIIQILLVLMFLWSSISNYRYKHAAKRLQEINLSHESDINMYKSVIEKFYINEGVKGWNYGGKDQNGENILLSDLLKDVPNTLVFKYRLSDCFSCVSAAFEKLKLLEKHWNLVVISDFESFAEMKYIQRKYKFDNLVLLRTEKIKESDTTPCIYQLDSKLQIFNYLEIFVNDKILSSYIKVLNKLH